MINIFLLNTYCTLVRTVYTMYIDCRMDPDPVKSYGSASGIATNTTMPIVFFLQLEFYTTNNALLQFKLLVSCCVQKSAESCSVLFFQSLHLSMLQRATTSVQVSIQVRKKRIIIIIIIFLLYRSKTKNYY